MTYSQRHQTSADKQSAIENQTQLRKQSPAISPGVLDNRAATNEAAQLVSTMNTSSMRDNNNGLRQLMKSHAKRQNAPASNRSSYSPIQGKFLLKTGVKATAELNTAIGLFMSAITAQDSDLFKLINESDDINVIVDPGNAIGVPGSGATTLERNAGVGKKEEFHNLFDEIPTGNAVTDDMRNQPLAIRIKIDQKGLSGLWTGDAMQLAETLAHEYHLHAEAQFEVIRILRDKSLSNEEARVALIAAQSKGLFNSGDDQHAQLTGKKGDRYEAMKTSIDHMKSKLKKEDADKLQKCFEDDQKDLH